MKAQKKTGWSPERRAAQSANIRKWKPWAKSTGPKTESGKKRAAMNAWKHGMRSRATITLCRTLNRYARFLTRFNLDLSLRARSAKLSISTNELLENGGNARKTLKKQCRPRRLPAPS